MSNERESSEDNFELDPSDAAQRRTLLKVLFINLAQAIVVGVAGALADSTSLMGAALDNFADGIVYGLGIYAVGHTVVAKARVARLSGTFLILLAVGLLIEVLRRFFARWRADWSSDDYRGAGECGDQSVLSASAAFASP